MSKIINLENIIDVMEMNIDGSTQMLETFNIKDERVDPVMESIMDIIDKEMREQVDRGMNITEDGHLKVELSFNKALFYMDAIKIILEADMNEAENAVLMLFAAEIYQNKMAAMDKGISMLEGLL